MIKQLPAFPAAPVYAPATLADIKAQYRFEGAETVKIGAPIVLSDGAVIEDGAIITGEYGKFEFDCPYFGAGDFTVEAKITFQVDSKPVFQILGTINKSGAVNQNNSWVLYAFTVPGRTVRNLVFDIFTGGAAQAAQALLGDVYPDIEYHIVIERVGSVIFGYVNGRLITSFEYRSALHNAPIGIITSYNIGAQDEFGGIRRIRDIRIASRALYHGAIYNNFKGTQTPS